MNSYPFMEVLEEAHEITGAFAGAFDLDAFSPEERVIRRDSRMWHDSRCEFARRAIYGLMVLDGRCRQHAQQFSEIASLQLRAYTSEEIEEALALPQHKIIRILETGRRYLVEKLEMDDIPQLSKCDGCLEWQLCRPCGECDRSVCVHCSVQMDVSGTHCVSCRREGRRLF